MRTQMQTVEVKNTLKADLAVLVIKSLCTFSLCHYRREDCYRKGFWFFKLKKELMVFMT